MEYKKDIRTKNLTLRDIHVGDWVQVWNEVAERYSLPLRIISICDDGTIYLALSDEERLAPWEENIKNVDALRITPDLLKGFGFDLSEFTGYSGVHYKGTYIGQLRHNDDNGIYYLMVYRGVCQYMHELVEDNYRHHLNINYEWKGVKNGN